MMRFLFIALTTMLFSATVLAQYVPVAVNTNTHGVYVQLHLTNVNNSYYGTNFVIRGTNLFDLLALYVPLTAGVTNNGIVINGAPMTNGSSITLLTNETQNLDQVLIRGRDSGTNFITFASGSWMIDFATVNGYGRLATKAGASGAVVTLYTNGAPSGNSGTLVLQSGNDALNEGRVEIRTGSSATKRLVIDDNGDLIVGRTAAISPAFWVTNDITYIQYDATTGKEAVNYLTMTGYVAQVTNLLDVAYKSRYNVFASSNKFNGQLIIGTAGFIEDNGGRLRLDSPNRQGIEITDTTRSLYSTGSVELASFNDFFRVVGTATSGTMVVNYQTAASLLADSFAFLAFTSAVNPQVTAGTYATITNWGYQMVQGVGVTATNETGQLVLPAGIWEVFCQLSFNTGAGADIIFVDLFVNTVERDELAFHRTLTASYGSASFHGPVVLTASSVLTVQHKISAGSDNLTFVHGQFYARRLR